LIGFRITLLYQIKRILSRFLEYSGKKQNGGGKRGGYGALSELRGKIAAQGELQALGGTYGNYLQMHRKPRPRARGGTYYEAERLAF
jgi:hypothetical protein